MGAVFSGGCSVAVLRCCFGTTGMWLCLQFFFTTVPIRLMSSTHNSQPGILIKKEKCWFELQLLRWKAGREFFSASRPFCFLVSCAAVIWSVHIYYCHCHPLWAFPSAYLKYYYYFNTFLHPVTPWERFSGFLSISDNLNFPFESECLFSVHFFHVLYNWLDVCLLFLQLSLFCAKWSRTVRFCFRNSSSLYSF